MQKKETCFWEYIERFDYVELTETSKTNGRADYPEDIDGNANLDRKKKTKGRTNGGIPVEVRRVLIRRNHVKGAIETKIRIENDTWIVWTIYSQEKLAELLKRIEIIQEEERNTKMLLGGDFNARTREKGGIYEGENKKRSSKDKVCDREGEVLLEVVENNGWHILNEGSGGI